MPRKTGSYDGDHKGPSSTEGLPRPSELSMEGDGLPDVRKGSEEKSQQVVTRGQRWIMTFAFFFLGMCSLFAWTNVLYVLPYMTEHFLDNWDAGNSLLGVFQVGNLIVQAYMMAVGAMWERWLYQGLSLTAILCAIFTPCIMYGSVTLRIALLHILCFFLGAASGFLQGSGYSFSSVMPVNQIAVYTTGQAIGAVFSVVLMAVLCFTVIDLRMQHDVVILLYVISALSAAFCIITLVLIYRTMKQPAAARAIKNAQASTPKPKKTSKTGPTEITEVTTDASQAVDGSEVRKGVCYRVLKISGTEIFCIFVVFFITCNLFPRVGPLQWRITDPPRNYYVWILGIFPFGDSFGRCLCTLTIFRWLTNIILFPPKLLPWMCLGRFLLYIPFFLSKHLQNNSVFNSFWFQMVEMAVLSTTHGWFTTLGFMYGLGKAPDDEKKYVGPAAVISLILGIIAGLYLALLFR
ncbi:uncharacterized protein LOC34619343 [Cyclospora cayetanensis]|uniref:Uncharacterized protein LOC34619343 n=1 Tax=Cyclospora cayetanensis TaxID=88456 RepID=A0A6P6RXR4_9EIME|nr:uncharacterized protein LOC34619343 [Cyclospora cayetanensis]